METWRQLRGTIFFIILMYDAFQFSHQRGDQDPSPGSRQHVCKQKTLDSYTIQGQKRPRHIQGNQRNIFRNFKLQKVLWDQGGRPGSPLGKSPQGYSTRSMSSLQKLSRATRTDFQYSSSRTTSWDAIVSLYCSTKRPRSRFSI